jgi:nucleoside phosphorylase
VASERPATRARLTAYTATHMGCDILLLAAFHPELAPLQPALGSGMRARVGGRDVAARAVGIGLPLAAAGTATQLLEMQPRAVVLLGTCGAYLRAGIALGEVVSARRVCLVSHSVAQGKSQFPAPMSLVSDADSATFEALVRAGARAADVATTLAITVDDGAAARVAQVSGSHVEHLEAYGVAAACAARGIPFGAALGVANEVGVRARDQWRTNHRASAAAAVELVLGYIQSGAG